MWEEFAQTVLLIVAGLLPIINPPAAALMALGIVPHASDLERRELARRIALNSLVILLASLSVGAYVLNFFGISIPVLRVAGGIVIATAGWTLLQSPAEEPLSEAPLPVPRSMASLRLKAFYPLTLPVTVGPGAIAVAIALGTGLPRSGLSVGHVAGVVVAMLLIVVSIYVCMRYAGHLERLLGSTGTQVAMRLFAFVIFCIGVQIFWLGLSDLIRSLR